MLRKAEKDYLNGKLKPKPNYRHKLNHAIRKKTFRALEDLTLVFEKMTARQLHFYRDKYGEALELFRKIQINPGVIMLNENLRFEEISVALELAHIRYDRKKLFLSDTYRDQMILHISEEEKRTGRDFWKPLPVEYKRQKIKEWKLEGKNP